MEDPGSATCDVAIVGYGPVGAVLAGLLARDGLRVVVVEREREIYRLPRAVHFDHEIMRVFQSLGLAETLSEGTAPIEGYEFWSAGREILFRYDLEQQTTDQGWQPDYMFHQPTLEAKLRRAAETHPEVRVRLGTAVTDLEDAGDHVELELRDGSGGEAERLRARYVVGCDGAGSFVRRRAGLALDDLEFDEPWLVVDATIDRPREELGLPRAAVQLCDPARPVTFVPVAGPYVRWEFMLRPGEDGREMLRPERVRALVAEWTDPDRVEVIRSAVYDFHALVAKRWRAGRILLAGDAAHQMPPFLGQGLCSGVRDATNLAWKLRAVLEAGADPAILDTYQSERDPHVRTIIAMAVAMGRIICTQDPEAAAARDAELLAREDRERTQPPPPPVGPGLLAADDDLAGRLALQARVRREDGTTARLDDFVGPGFAILGRGAAPPELSPLAAKVLERIGGRVLAIDARRDADGDYARWFEQHGVDAVLVRPDHVAFGGARGGGAATSLLESLGRQLGMD